MQALVEERKKTTFDYRKLERLVHGKELEKFHERLQFLASRVQYDANCFNEGRIEMIKDSIRVTPLLNDVLEAVPGYCILPWLLQYPHQCPGGLHYGMFMTCIRMLGTDKQQEQFLPKCHTNEIVGCYAQTELGHGSDVQSLETTAIFDKAADQFILNSPSISSAKYWPGDLGFAANYAMVFAKLLVQGNELGTYPFLVRIRDDKMQPLPGVEVGDIGPKFGFLTKDNGYMMMNNLRIPRSNMLSKYVGINREGDLQVNGNPKIVYATMMIVRKIISTVWPKVYAQGIAVACRYSIFRRQFKNEHGQEMAIVEYQTQQAKLLPLIAQFYAITLSGHRIAKLTEQNFKRVTEQNDDTLMAEAHASLCYGKAYFTDVVNRGLEICRLSCGGHGFAEYSGLPNMCKEFSANVTYEGENSVMYLQIARYVMKSFKASVIKKKRDLLNTVKYLNSIQYYRESKCTVPEGRPDLWTIQEVRLLLGKSTCYLIDYVYDKQLKNEGGSKQQTKDKIVGIRLIELAVAHSIYNTYACFEETVVKLPDEKIKKILFMLCMLYGINNILGRSNYLIESGGIEPHHLESLRARMEILLKSLRPHMIGLVDGFGLPDSCLRSPMVTAAEPYEAVLNVARKGSLNQGWTDAAMIIKKGMHAKL